MTLSHRFWIFTLAGAGIIFLIIAGMAVYVWLHLTPDQAKAAAAFCKGHAAVLLGGFLLLCLVFWAASDLVYAGYIKPVKKMSAEVAMIYASNPALRIPVTGNQDIQALARTINTFADLFENQNQTIAQQVVAARKETEQERNLLAAIMGELPQGVIICNVSGRILLYNSLAKTIFTQTRDLEKTEHFMGLGRSIFHLVDKELISHAIEEITEQLASRENSAGSYFITPVSGNCLISVETIPVLDKNNRMTGFILAFQEISQDIKKYESIQAHLAQFLQALEKKSPAAEGFYKLSDTIQDIFLSRLPLTRMDLAQFLFRVQKLSGQLHGIRINVYNRVQNERIMADTYSLTQAFVFLFNALTRFTGFPEFDICTSTDHDRIRCDITWEDYPVKIADLETIKHQHINALPGFESVLKLNNTRFDILTADKTTSSHVTLSVRKSTETAGPLKHRTPIMAGSRPEFYDFDLFQVQDRNKNLLDTRLKEISYTVFDTETTGLNPEGGDEIISMGAVRIVNNRILVEDVFEELVDPRRDIPVASYRIHGINHEMVAEKDPIEKVLPRFRQFVADTVLVGHNIAFDMKMLALKEKTTNIRFANPILDTLLLSAILHPIHEQHDMENIAKRLGIDIIGRHTALGDAISTAQIFLKLIPVLNSNGILTLGDAITASKKSYYARVKY
ncbi:MAG: exonuclease domain-containing protein [Desulfotignum sp.]|jgi:DNA polymerase-3 subunit epsilon|nr:exonuclease domain-containing protein [Desulfotignum sp.]